MPRKSRRSKFSKISEGFKKSKTSGAAFKEFLLNLIPKETEKERKERLLRQGRRDMDKQIKRKK